MATYHFRALRGNLHALDSRVFMLPPLDLNHQINGDLFQRIENNLVGLPGLDPGDVLPLNAGMDFRLQVAPGDRPTLGKGQDHEVARSEKKVPGGDDMLDQVERHVGRRVFKRCSEILAGVRPGDLYPCPCISSFYQ